MGVALKTRICRDCAGTGIDPYASPRAAEHAMSKILIRQAAGGEQFTVQLLVTHERKGVKLKQFGSLRAVAEQQAARLARGGVMVEGPMLDTYIDDIACESCKGYGDGR